MRGRLVVAVCAALLAAAAAPAAAAAQGPAGAVDGVRLIRNLPGMKCGDGDQLHPYGRQDVMFVTGRFGLRAYDVTEPTEPRLLDSIGNEELRLHGDPPVDTDDSDGEISTYWQNEDMDLDKRRKLVFLARDPRSYNGTTAATRARRRLHRRRAQPGEPRAHHLPRAAGRPHHDLRERLRIPVDRRARSANGQTAGADWRRPADLGHGHPRPRHPTTSPHPVDMFRNDGVTAYSHDVQVDEKGIAWVSGAGGVRGYWTEGTHWDPLHGVRARGDSDGPGPLRGRRSSTTARAVGVHAQRVRRRRATSRRRAGPRLREPGELLLATEEADAPPDCDGLGRSPSRRCEGSYDGEAWRSTPEDPFRLKTVGTWSPQTGGQLVNARDCSAHYFEMQDDVVAYSWYAQGTRFLDVSRPGEPDPGRLLPSRRRRLMGALLPPRLRLRGGPRRGVDILRASRAAHRRCGAAAVRPPPAARRRRLARAWPGPGARLGVPAAGDVRPLLRACRAWPPRRRAPRSRARCGGSPARGRRATCRPAGAGPARRGTARA